MADKQKQQKTHMTKEEKNLALLEIQKIKEKAFKLRVKIISWESGSLGSQAVSLANKITPAEWTEYKKHRKGVFSVIDEGKVKSDLEKTYTSIKINGGFE